VGVEDHRSGEDISEDSSTDDGADITVEVREEADVDCEVDHQEDDEVLDDAVVSDFFEEQDIGDEGRYHGSIEQMIDRCESADMRDIIDDEDGNEDDIEELEQLLGSTRHRSQEAVNRFHRGRVVVLLGCGDPFASEDAPHGDFLLLVCRLRLELKDLVDEIIEPGQDE